MELGIKKLVIILSVVLWSSLAWGQGTITLGTGGAAVTGGGGILSLPQQNLNKTLVAPFYYYGETPLWSTSAVTDFVFGATTAIETYASSNINAAYKIDADDYHGVGQGFSVSKCTMLESITLYLARGSSNTQPNITVYVYGGVWKTNAGVSYFPGGNRRFGTLLSTITVSTTSFPIYTDVASLQPIIVTLPTPIVLKTSSLRDPLPTFDNYAILIQKIDGGSTDDFIMVGYDSTGTYSTGNLIREYYLGNNDNHWLAFVDEDLAFAINGKAPSSTLSVNGFLQAQSFCDINLHGDTLEWMELPPGTPTGDGAWEATRAAADGILGAVHLSYQFIIYVYSDSASSLKGGDVGNFPYPYPWWIGFGKLQLPAESIATAFHELNHSLGGSHLHDTIYTTKYLSTSPNVIGLGVPTGQLPFYYNYGELDLSGDNGYFYDFSIAQRENVGWTGKPHSSIPEITLSGIYTINPLESSEPGMKGIKILRQNDVANNDIQYYYIEYRTPIGTDYLISSDPTGPESVMIYYTMNNKAGSGLRTDTVQAYRLDMSPESNTGGSRVLGYDRFDKPALRVGETFYDSERNITIENHSISSSGAELHVTIGTPPTSNLRAYPTIVVGEQQNSSTLHYHLAITNNDPAYFGSSEFVYELTASELQGSYTIPASLTHSFSPATLTIAPGSTEYVTLTITSEENTWEWVPVRFWVTVSNITNPLFWSSVQAEYISPTGENWSYPGTRTYDYPLSDDFTVDAGACGYRNYFDNSGPYVYDSITLPAGVTEITRAAVKLNTITDTQNYKFSIFTADGSALKTNGTCTRGSSPTVSGGWAQCYFSPVVSVTGGETVLVVATPLYNITPPHCYYAVESGGQYFYDDTSGQWSNQPPVPLTGHGTGGNRRLAVRIYAK